MDQRRRTHSLIFLSLVCSACGRSPNDDVADRMEEAVRDSDISFTEIEDYSQYFFERENGAIIGVFVRHYPNSSERRDLVSADCLSRHPTEYPCNEPNYGVADPGEREWVPSEFNLPAVAGGGCSVITFQTDASRNNISQPECNGPY